MNKLVKLDDVIKIIEHSFVLERGIKTHLITNLIQIPKANTMNDLDFEQIKSLQEWAIKQASKYDRKYAKYNDARAWVNAQRYDLVIELCDKVQGRAE